VYYTAFEFVSKWHFITHTKTLYSSVVRPGFKVVTDLRFVMTQQFRPNTNLTMRTRLITPRPVEHEESSVLLNVNPVGQEITVGTRCTNDRCFCPPCAHNQWVESQYVSLRNQKGTNGRIVPLHLSPVMIS